MGNLQNQTEQNKKSIALGVTMKPGGPSWGLWKMREELGVSTGGHHLFDAKAMKQNSFHQIPVL